EVERGGKGDPAAQPRRGGCHQRVAAAAPGGNFDHIADGAPQLQAERAEVLGPGHTCGGGAVHSTPAYSSADSTTDSQRVSVHSSSSSATSSATFSTSASLRSPMT